MADRKVTFTLGTKVDPQAKRDASELATLLKSIQSAADAATKSVKATFAASARVRGGPAAGSGPGGGPTRQRATGGHLGGFGAGYDRAAMDDLRRQRADERKEREGILADRRREAEAERRILAERVRANVEASKKIRNAARDARADNYRAKSAGTYGAGFGRGGSSSGPELPSDNEFKKHIESVAKAYEAQEKAAEKAAAAHRANVSALVSGSKQAAAGVGNIARAFVYLGVSGEKNIESALRLLAKFEAGMAGIRGASDLIGGIAKAGKAYRGLGAGAGLAAGVGAVGVAGSAVAGAAAFGVGAGVGLGVGRAAIGESSFNRMTDWAGVTDHAGERAAATKERIARSANRRINSRNRTAASYADFTTEADIDLQYAEGTGGLSGAMQQSQANVAAARRRSQDLNERINTGRAGSYEEQTGELVAAKQSEATALNAALQIEERRKNVLKQTVEAEREKTKAVKDGLEASKASLGLADDQTVRLAERGAAKRAKGEKLSRDEAGALGQFFGEVGQQEAAKLGEDVLKKNPELAKLAEEIAKARAAQEKAVLVKVEQELTGKITVSPDSAKLMADIEAVIKMMEEQRRAALKEALQAEQRDRDSQAALQRGSSGA